MNWIAKRRIFYIFSGALLILALIGIGIGGLKPGLDFTGGTEWVVTSNVPQNELESELGKAATTDNVIIEYVQNSGKDQYTIQMGFVDETEKAKLTAALLANNVQLSEVSFQTIGASVSGELIQKTAFAVGLGTLFILLFVWRQFKDWRFGLAAIIAMLHDTTIVVGSFAWLGYFFHVQVDILIVTAILTTLSFSVHDTIVVFDRIRELQKTFQRGKSPEFLANTAITQTLIRSLNNSLTILVMLLSVLILGGGSLHWFAAALFIGTLTGAYSSPFIAVPLWFELQRVKKN